MTLESHKTKAILVSSIGGGLEMYDFTIYVFFATMFAKLFFPEVNSVTALLNTFAIFAVGYFSRPLGAMVFGHYGDKAGRKKGMLISIGIMAVATLCIGLLPTYAQVGIAAPIALVLLRFLQGFAVGGDLPGAITFVAEYAENKKRGLACSFVYCAVNLGLLLASAVAALLTSLLSPESLMSWGWRIAFILGLFIGIIGLYLRRKIAETPYFSELEHTKNITKIPLLQLFKFHKKQIAIGVGLVWLFSVIIAQIFLYMPTYLHTIGRLELHAALVVNSVNVLLFSLSIPLMGYLSDKIGRRRIILITAFLFIILSYPLYTSLNSNYFSMNILGLVSFAVLSAGIVGTVPSALSEMFPTQIRYSGVAFAYNFGFAIFAGLTPIIATYLFYTLKFPQAPCCNLIVAGVMTFLSALFMKEGSRQSLAALF